MNFNIIRHVKEPITLEGYVIPKGSMLQAPMMAAHYDDGVWGVAAPAYEFSAQRHIKCIEEKDDSGNTYMKRVFATAGRPSSYFPFGT